MHVHIEWVDGQWHELVHLRRMVTCNGCAEGGKWSKATCPFCEAAGVREHTVVTWFAYPLHDWTVIDLRREGWPDA